MASPSADEATDLFLGGVATSHSESPANDEDDDVDSVPPSPELGMTIGEDVYVSDIDLSEEGRGNVVSETSPRQPYSPIRSHDETRIEDRTGRTHLTQDSPPVSAQRANLEPAGASLITPASTGPSVRRSARAKSKLVYDRKYHPMDDFIRPSQAAKRRSLHGESPLLDDHSEDDASEVSSSDGGSKDDDQESDSEDSRPPTRGRKRKRSPLQTPEPTRRSSRRRTEPKMSYDMKIHPQDSDLRQIGACDGCNSSPDSKKPESARRSKAIEKGGPATGVELYERAREPRRDGYIRGVQPAFPQDSPIRQEPLEQAATGQIIKLADTYPDLQPDLSYLAGNQELWPVEPGLPFSIYTERMEDQLNAEAEAASPLRFADDDKENDEVNPELVLPPNPLDGISIIPASQYRRTSVLHPMNAHHLMVRNPLHEQPRFEVSTYGLSWSDDGHDLNDGDTQNCPIPDYTRILASRETLPQPMWREMHAGSSDVTVSSSPLRSVEGIDLRR
ncbi:hypothetical protein E8E13_007198 [Curvularia kusanoi]|uniref:Uncharacterized protein n=1 Tax=Curvularia kusanoi TaxID=90978 RepID=A0A9P4TGI1_CURKU|nr:hypothetical protein E8E13_007198 [Curvularia kusanoi]